MRRALAFCVFVCLPIAAQQAPIPTTTELPGTPFFVKKSWFIGGTGSWDYVTMDIAARRLFIAHGPSVQVVDVDSGALVGEIRGLREARSIALDNTGSQGYVSDGPAGEVKVFDRHGFQVEATIPIHCSPRSIAFEPQSKFVFAICGANPSGPGASPNQRPDAGGSRTPRQGEKPEPANVAVSSHIIVIETEKNTVVADIDVAGDFRYALPDGDGQIYVTVGAVEKTYVDKDHTVHAFFPQRIAKLDAAAIGAEVQRHLDERPRDSSSSEPLFIDWSLEANPKSLVHFLPLPATCKNPQGVAVDSKDQRLFAACEGQLFLVLNAMSGDIVASLTTGPGDDVIGYDQERELIFIANGGGYGSLTIVRQDATTDSYAVIQNLPTEERTRTLAVDSATGEVYLVTDFHGVDLTKSGGIGTLHAEPVQGSFHVLVVGH
jgi:DNA-binding beta-propeller fold protein YncE